MDIRLLYPVLFPILAGVFLLIKKEYKQRIFLLVHVGVTLLTTGAMVIYAVCSGEESYTVFHLTRELPVYFKLDDLGRFFVTVMSIVWIAAGFFSFSYMKKEHKEKRFFGFYLVVYGILAGLYFSGNLITMYLFYELMTLFSLPFVLHSQTREAVMAGLKYLFYSFCGAYMALFGIYFVFHYGSTITFTPGGVFEAAVLAENQTLFLVVSLLFLIGFGVKAGMFPLHGWLPTAHPVAPGPASAVLSGIIVKSGVFALIRVMYYLIGPDFIRGTWVQTVWMTLSLVTVFMGSMLAYREPVLKKRLAYSTVSQISYILFGLSLMNKTAATGALLHVTAHAFIKAGLFLWAGAVIYKTGKNRADDLRGIGKQMPVSLWCYTLFALGLIGIPPASGFISKWYLAEGALSSGISLFSWLGPVVLLVSALLTAGYLLPITMHGFFPGRDYDGGITDKKELPMAMMVPLILLAALTIAVGLLPHPLIRFLMGIVGEMM